MTDSPASSLSGPDRQRTLYQLGIHGRRPSVPTDARTLEAAAEQKLSEVGWAYVSAGAGERNTMQANRDAFRRWQIVPRMLRDVSERDLSTQLLGRTIPAPVLFAPVGASDLVHPRADLAVAEAAAAMRLPYIFTNQAGTPIEVCAAAMGDSPRWFQLYWSKDDELVDSFIGRAENAGAEALVVTLDTTMLGWRPRDLNLSNLPFARGEGIAQYTSDPRFLALVRERVRATAGTKRQQQVSLGALKTLLSISRNHPGRTLANVRSPEPLAAVQTFLDVFSRPSLTWSDIATLRQRTSLPVLLKGIQHPDDARRALDHGVDGVYVSNHGGRQVDGAIGSLDALAEIAPAVDGKAAIVFDSGVRSGSDVFKALAIGADAVAIGRPYLFGLALDGARGAQDAVANIVAELDLTMGLSGLRTINEITKDALRTA